MFARRRRAARINRSTSAPEMLELLHGHLDRRSERSADDHRRMVVDRRCRLVGAPPEAGEEVDSPLAGREDPGRVSGRRVAGVGHQGLRELIRDDTSHNSRR